MPSFTVHTKQGLGQIAIVIILAVLIGGGYLFARKAGYFPETAQSDIIKPQTQTSVNTSDWKTYRNKEYGFEFRYPPYFYIHPSTMPEVFVNQHSTGNPRSITYGSLAYQVPPTKEKYTSLDDYINVISSKKYQNWRMMEVRNEIVVDGRKAYEMSVPGGDIPFTTVLLSNATGQIYFIDFMGSEEESNLTQLDHQILSTFKFTK